MKVYVLDSGGCMDQSCERIGIFSTREKAEKVKAERNNYDDNEVEEVELDEYAMLNPDKGYLDIDKPRWITVKA